MSTVGKSHFLARLFTTPATLKRTSTPPPLPPPYKLYSPVRIPSKTEEDSIWVSCKVEPKFETFTLFDYPDNTSFVPVWGPMDNHDETSLGRLGSVSDHDDVFINTEFPLQRESLLPLDGEVPGVVGGDGDVLSSLGPHNDISVSKHDSLHHHHHHGDSVLGGHSDDDDDGEETYGRSPKRQRTNQGTPSATVACTLCPASLSSYTVYKMHMANVHGATSVSPRGTNGSNHHGIASSENERGGQVESCNMCGKVFRVPSRLARHIAMVHEGKRQFRCEQPGCDRLFFQRSQLARHHRTIHEMRRDFNCEQCGKSFGEKGNLVVHIKTVHEGLREYSCDQCTRTFGQASTLRAHVSATHEKRKEYACHMCTAAFAQRSTLSSHIRVIHERRKDFVCNQCDKAFGQRGDLNRHIRTAHEKRKDWKCPSCNSAFTERGTLVKHMKSHDNNSSLYTQDPEDSINIDETLGGLS